MEVLGALACLGFSIYCVVSMVRSRDEMRRTDEDRPHVAHLVCTWAGQRAWTAPEPPTGDPLGTVDPRLHPGARVLAEVTGDHAGYECAILVGYDDSEDSTPRWTACLAKLERRRPPIEVRRRYEFPLRRKRARNPAWPESDAGAVDFDRHFVVGRNPTGLALLTGPVREALLHLRRTGDFKPEFFAVRDDTLRVMVGGWPPAVTLATLLDEVVALAAMLSAVEHTDGSDRG